MQSIMQMQQMQQMMQMMQNKNEKPTNINVITNSSNNNTNTNQNTNVNGSAGDKCDSCNLFTVSYARKTHGTTSLIWCLALTFLTGGLIFCLGCNQFERCKDT